MGGIYRQTRPDGSVVYTDQPAPGATSTKAMAPDGRRSSTPSHEEVRQYIKDTQKYVPKVEDYLNYIEFLRSHSPSRHRLMLEQLRREDLQAYLKLQKYPQFRPLHETALGVKAAEKNIGAAIGLATGKFTGSIEKWMETSLKDMMKQQRWGPYADVLGAKATTLPVKVPSYSNSRLGHYLRTEDGRAIGTAKQVAQGAEQARAAVRFGVASAITRPGNVLLDLGIAALTPEAFSGISAIQAVRLGNQLVEQGVLYPEEALELRGMMARGEFDQAIQLIEAGRARASRSRQ